MDFTRVGVQLLADDCSAHLAYLLRALLLFHKPKVVYERRSRRHADDDFDVTCFFFSLSFSVSPWMSYHARNVF
jgi:hypothetical protein